MKARTLWLLLAMLWVLLLAAAIPAASRNDQTSVQSCTEVGGTRA